MVTNSKFSHADKILSSTKFLALDAKYCKAYNAELDNIGIWRTRGSVYNHVMTKASESGDIIVMDLVEFRPMRHFHLALFFIYEEYKDEDGTIQTCARIIPKSNTMPIINFDTDLAYIEYCKNNIDVYQEKRIRYDPEYGFVLPTGSCVNTLEDVIEALRL